MEMPRPGDALSGWSDRFVRIRDGLERYGRSLLGQIVLLVLLATGLTALLAAWASTATIHRYLDDRIEQRFPSLINAKAHEIDLWYQRARLDIDTFARSQTLIHNVPRLDTDAGGAARDEIHTYLEYIQQRFDRYPALFLLARGGEEILHFGREIAFPEEVRAELPDLDQPRVHGVIRQDDRRLQIASAPVPGPGRVSLHAVIDLAALDVMLGLELENDATEVYLIDADGHYVAGTRGMEAESFVYSGPDESGGPGVSVYVNGMGERVVGGIRTLGLFGWSIVVEQGYEVAYEPVGALISRVFWIDVAIGLVLVVIAIRLAASVIRPVGALSSAAQSVAGGNTDVRLEEPRGAPELADLTRAFNQMTHHLHIQRQELERQNDELQRLSVTDGLTGVFNRRYFEEQLPLEIKRAERQQLRLALIVLDIDDFKRINDTLGHAVGDRILCAVAEALGTELRATDMLARYGGEEFVVLNLQEDSNGAKILADKMIGVVAALEWPAQEWCDESGAPLRVTMSAGVALHDGDAEALFRDADAALYEAKRAGKNRVVVAGAGSGSGPESAPEDTG